MTTAFVLVGIGLILFLAWSLCSMAADFDDHEERTQGTRRS
jgi:hypothetical protein